VYTPPLGITRLASGETAALAIIIALHVLGIGGY
jgi:hypothetical protein